MTANEASPKKAALFVSHRLIDQEQSAGNTSGEILRPDIDTKSARAASNASDPPNCLGTDLFPSEEYPSSQMSGDHTKINESMSAQHLAMDKLRDELNAAMQRLDAIEQSHSQQDQSLSDGQQAALTLRLDALEARLVEFNAVEEQSEISPDTPPHWIEEIVRRLEASNEASHMLATQALSDTLLSVLAEHTAPDPSLDLARVNELLCRLDSTEVEKGPTAINGEPGSTHLDTICKQAVEAALRPVLEDFSASISALMDRPDPVLDLTEQRQFFSRFGTAIGHVVKRLDRIADRYEASQLEPPTNTTELKETVDRILDLQTKQTESIKAQSEPYSNGGSPELYERLENLSSMVSEIAARPDPVLDLTVQRRSFAQFNTAAGVVLRRIEEATIRRDDPQYEEDEHARGTFNEQVAAGPNEFASGNLSELISAIKSLALANEALSCQISLTTKTPDLEPLRDFLATIAETLALFAYNAEVTETDR
ncbi:MAG: hypothetical protein AAF871_03920 [Pseudomonadota bacterium]